MARPPYTVKVTSRDVHQDGKGQDFVLYRHEASRGDERHVILSRYSRFVWLDEQVRAAYKGNHLLSSVPSLPKKQWKLMVDHKSDAFLDDRQLQLEHYLQTLARLPGIDKVDAFNTFITTNFAPTPSNDQGTVRITTTATTSAGRDDPAAADTAPTTPTRSPTSATPTSAPPGDFVMIGFLAKEGAVYKGFRRRWFCLSKTGELTYFTNAKDRVPKGSITLDRYAAVRKVEAAQPVPHSFQLVTPNRVYVLAADTEDLRNRWCDAISQFARRVSAIEAAAAAKPIYDDFV